MKSIETALQPTHGYIKSFNRNPLNGWWELEIALPKAWVFDENENIKCEVITENNVGRLIKVEPKTSEIIIDDLIKFVEIIIDTNKKIAEREKEFAEKMEELKKDLEKQATNFYKELDELKENSFKNLSNKFTESIIDENREEKKETRGRKPKEKSLSDKKIDNLNDEEYFIDDNAKIEESVKE